MIEIILPSHTTLFQQDIIPERIPEEEDNMSIMIEGSLNEFGKRPLHNKLDSMNQPQVDVFPYFPSKEATYKSGGDDNAVMPTADDYANLFFCESFEEEDARASLNKDRSLSNDTSQTRNQQSKTSKSNQKTKPKRRRVHFGTSISKTIHRLEDVAPANSMTPDEKSTLWFSRPDLEMFKSSAQSSIQDMRSRIMDNDNGGPQQQYKNRTKFRSMMLTLETETNASIRGLEHRVFRRKQTRQMLIRDVLDCQSHLQGLSRFGHEMDVNEKCDLLSKVSMERSGKAKGVAFVDARDDYEEIYGDKKNGGDNVCGRVHKRQKHSRNVSI